jgi:hypothetical protein
VDLAKSIILNLEIDYPGLPGLFGVLLTQEKRFIKFRIVSEEREPEVVEWLDITATQNFSKHNKGTGVGYGALAIQLLHELVVFDPQSGGVTYPDGQKKRSTKRRWWQFW